MNIAKKQRPISRAVFTATSEVVTRFSTVGLRHLIAGILGVTSLYLSMVTTSAPMRAVDRAAVDRAIDLLESQGFGPDATLLRTTATFRSSDNWLNTYLVPSENAYASTNFPVGIITIYPDFYKKAVDDTERAMVLLHEAQHLKGADEREAYSYVWDNRSKLGWTLNSHGTTESYISIELQTREYAPEIFTCEEKPFRDCTEL